MKIAINIIQWMGGLMAFVALVLVLYGVWRGTQRQIDKTSGHTGTWLRSPWFYIGSSVLFFGFSYFGWIPLPLRVPSSIRIVMLVLGSLLYFPGMALLLWGRLALGRNYFVSTGLGAQLFSDQQLVTTGPYAIVRHPMYAGLILSALGSLLIYTTWTTVYFACSAPLMFIRALREESALSAEFGEQWEEYCNRVPAFIPRLRKERHDRSQRKG
jgi:protein-S-isoprenylcysteine O-methyltransferase Ste14